MKLFGGKKGDDKAPMQGGDDDEAGYYDSPVENVSLSDPSLAPRRRAPPARSLRTAAAARSSSSRKRSRARTTASSRPSS